MGQIDPGGGEGVEQRGELGDLVALRADLDLAHHQGVVVGGGGEQMDLVALGVGSTANRLAVHHDREQLGDLPVGPGRDDLTGDDLTRSGVARSGLGEEPGTDHRIHRGGVGTGDHPPDRGLRRRSGASTVELHEHLGGHIGGPAGDRGKRGHTRHDRRRAQRQHHRDRVNPALVPAAVGHPPEPLQQVSTHSRRSRDVVGGGRARHGRAQPGESGLGNDRMQPQRSSGGEKSVRGLLLLPELRRLSRHDTPKITRPSAGDQPRAPATRSPIFRS